MGIYVPGSVYAYELKASIDETSKVSSIEALSSYAYT